MILVFGNTFGRIFTFRQIPYIRLYIWVLMLVVCIPLLEYYELVSCSLQFMHEAYTKWFGLGWFLSCSNRAVQTKTLWYHMHVSDMA